MAKATLTEGKAVTGDREVKSQPQVGLDNILDILCIKWPSRRVPFRGDFPLASPHFHSIHRNTHDFCKFLLRIYFVVITTTITTIIHLYSPLYIIIHLRSFTVNTLNVDTPHS